MKQNKNLGFDGWCILGIRFLVGLWAFLMLTVFPLYMRNHYSKMGVRKFEFFLAVSVGCLLPALVLVVVRAVQKCMAAARASDAPGLGRRPGSVLRSPGKQPGLAPRSPGEQPGSALRSPGRQSGSALRGLNALDRAMLVYVAAVFLSWLCGADRQTAWTGVDGWFMGLRTQLLFVLLYFLVSRFFPWKKLIFAGHFLGSGAVFLFGVLHRFGIDPLGMYEGIDESWQLLFLSTIGQASWYSSYVCTVLVIGVTFFFLSKKQTERMALGAYCVLGFATIVTQNSDSAFIAMAFLFFGLFLAACDSMDRMERFFEALLLMLGGFKLMGVFQMLFSQKAVELGGLSEFLSQSTATWLAFLAVCLAYMAFLFYRQKHPEQEALCCGGLLRKIAVIGVAVVLAGYVLLVYLNTAGKLPHQSMNQYLLFDKAGGNSRGFTWKFTVSTFAEFPLVNKLFGIGPDCFSSYCYADPDLGAYLKHFFGQNQTLTNAHNEFLNTLFCMGIAGLLAFTAIFVLAFQRFYKKRKEQPLVLLGMLVVLVYASHNFFCYQQVCCTPFFFLILGMAESRLRQAGQKT